MNFTDEDLKYMTMTSLTRSLKNIYNCYEKIYDMYHSENCDRDAVFIHDLADAIKGIEAVLEVYTRDKYIHPSYACEKLHYSYSNIKHVHDYFESKLKKGDVVQFNENHKWTGSLGIIIEVKQCSDDTRYMVGVPTPMQGTAFIYVMESENAIEYIGKAVLTLKDEEDK